MKNMFGLKKQNIVCTFLYQNISHISGFVFLTYKIIIYSLLFYKKFDQEVSIFQKFDKEMRGGLKNDKINFLKILKLPEFHMFHFPEFHFFNPKLSTETPTTYCWIVG